MDIFSKNYEIRALLPDIHGGWGLCSLTPIFDRLKLRKFPHVPKFDQFLEQKNVELRIQAPTLAKPWSLA